ncbi:MAG: helix-turn-helix domain-containing protein [Candidatus Heimdallarchaeota archaeon]|nr:helix-turn-helix domain-containing protein [Candidatus Heimdallarchaeota archaeon]
MSKNAYPELVDALSSYEQYGFTKLQAAAYIAILQLGEESGSAIAKQSGINRSKIYDTLTQLEEMGAVRVVSVEGRTRYSAVSPDQVLHNILNNFSQHLETNVERLKTLMGDQVLIDAKTMTLTKLKLKNLDCNDYTYLISSNERARGMFLDQINKEGLPGYEVKILNLNDHTNLGMILLLKGDEVLIFPTPTGSEVEAILYQDKDLSRFFLGLIESWWISDVPDSVMEQIESETIRALYIGKSLYMRYEWENKGEQEYSRPISFLITDEHLIFYYEGQPDPIPLFSITEVNILPDDSMSITFEGLTGKKLGEMMLKVVDRAIFMKNLLLSLSELARIKFEQKRSRNR